MHLLSKPHVIWVYCCCCCCCCCVPLPAGTHLGHHHEPMVSDGDGEDNESLLPLLSQSRSRHSPNAKHTICRGARGQPSPATLSLLLTHEIEIDESEGRDNPLQNSGFIVRVVDPILPVWFCCRKMPFSFRIRNGLIRDGLLTSSITANISLY